MKPRFLLLFTLGAAVALLLAVVAAAESPAPASTIVVAIHDEPTTLYIYGDSSGAAAVIQQAFLDGPIDTSNYGYQPVILEKLPDLEAGDAVTHTVTVHPGQRYVSDGQILTATHDLLATQMVVTFTLKAGLMWSDGNPLSAADSAFSFVVDCHPDTPTKKFTCDRTAGYTAVDRTAVWTGLPGYIDAQYFLRFWTPLPQHLLGDLTPKEILDSDYGRHPLGWGPFVVDEWLPGRSIRLVRNPNYGRPGLPLVDQLLVRVFANGDQALRALLRGEVHAILTGLVDEAQLPTYLDLEAQGVLDTAVGLTPSFEHIDLEIQPADSRPALFAGTAVRRAVAYGTNRQAIADLGTYGAAPVSDSFVPADHPFYPPPGVLAGYPYDPDLARSLLQAAGWRDADGDGIREAHGVLYQVPTWDWEAGTYGPTQTVTIPDGTPFVATLNVEALHWRTSAAAQFRQDMAAIGISATLEFMSRGDLFAPGPEGPLAGRRFDLAEYDRGFAWDGCAAYLAWSIPSAQYGWSGENYGGFVNPVYDAACSAALTSLSPEAQAGNYHTAQQVFSQQLPALPLFHRIKVVLTTPNLTGFSLDPTAGALSNVEELGLSSYGWVDPSTGGGVQSNDGRTQIVVAPGAVTDSVRLTFTPWVVVPGGTLVSIGHAFDLTAVYSDTGQPAQLLPGHTLSITIHYGTAELPAPVFEKSLALYGWDGSQWAREPTSAVDTAHNVITAAPGQFSRWAALVQVHNAYLPVTLRDARFRLPNGP